MGLSDCCNFYGLCVRDFIEGKQRTASANNLLFYVTKAYFCIALSRVHSSLHPY